jgi:hypothetical protein
MTRITASILSRPTPITPSTKRSTAAPIEIGISRLATSFCTTMGDMIAHIPTTTKRLKRLDPITLLIAIVSEPLRPADTLDASSGSEVPIATTVRPMIIEGTRSFFAIPELPSTKKSAPLIRNTKPITKSTAATMGFWIMGASEGNHLMRFSIFYFPPI